MLAPITTTRSTVFALGGAFCAACHGAIRDRTSAITGLMGREGKGKPEEERRARLEPGGPRGVSSLLEQRAHRSRRVAHDRELSHAAEAARIPHDLAAERAAALEALLEIGDRDVDQPLRRDPGV